MAGSSNLSEKLFEHYLKMTDSDIRDLGIDNEVGKKANTFYARF